MRLTWKKQPNETGLARVCQGIRGHDLRLDGVEVASVNYSDTNPFFPDRKTGWYWCAGTNKELGITHRNTSNGPLFDTPEEAKAACKAYVLQCIKSKPVTD